MADEMSEALQAMEANEPQANLYRAAEEYVSDQAYELMGIGDDDDIGVVVADVLDGTLQTLPAFGAIDFIEGCVGFVGHCVWCSLVDDLLVKLKNGVIHD